MRNARLDEAQDGIKISRRNIKTSDMKMTPPLWQKVKKELLDENERSGKAGFKLNIQKTEIMASGPITSWQIDGETMKTVTDYFLRLQICCG